MEKTNHTNGNFFFHNKERSRRFSSGQVGDEVMVNRRKTKEKLELR